MTTLTIAEMFYSVQGEGDLTGMPSVFIRLAGCNLRCSYCDTPKALKMIGAKKEVGEIIEFVEAFPTSYVVITGGEPFLQDISNLTQELMKAKKHITIETNGTIYRGDAICNLLSISPKMSNSDGDNKTHSFLRKRLLGLQNAHAQIQYKFVIGSIKDINEVKEFQNKHNLYGGDIMLMPRGKTKAEIKKRELKLIDICKMEGYRYCPRLHIDIWGKKKGV